MANLGPQKQSTSYLGLLQVPDGLTTVLKNVTDGLGASSPLQLSTTGIGFSSLTMTGPINMGGYQINNLGAPSVSTDAVTKAYVDSVATGLQPKQQCVAGTVANITLSGEQVIDDVSVVAGDRVLVKNQSIQANNGIYIVSSSAWTRSSDADTYAELVGAYVFTVSGTVNNATSWVCNSPSTGTLGSTAITWIKFSSSTSTLSNFLTFDSLGDGDQGYTDIAAENGYNIITEDSDYLTIQTPGLIQFNGSSPVLISYNSIGAIALDGSNAAPGSLWDIDISGNAGTVTNGVYTTGSYTNPAWITSIASSKLIGAVAVNRGGTGATSLSGILLGNGSDPVTTASASDIVGAIGSTPVANATNAISATSATTAATALVATSTTQTDFTNLTIAGSQVIDVANIGTYAPVTFINVKSYGAVGDGIANDTAAIQSAITANPGRTIYFPSGKYAITNVTIANTQTLIGDSAQNPFYYSGSTPTPTTMANGSVFIAYGGGTTDLFTVTTTAAVNFEKLAFYSASKRTGGSYITFQTPSNTGTNFGSRFINCQFVHAYDAIKLLDNAGWCVDKCYFANGANIGISVQNIQNPDYGDACITGCYFDANIGGTGGPSGATHILQQSSGGLKIVGNKFLSGQYHYLCQPLSGAATSILTISANSFEWASSYAIAFNSAGNSFYGISITGNEISVPSGGTGIYALGSSYNLTNISISGNVLLGSGTGLYMNSVANSVVGPNQFSSLTTGVQFSGSQSSVMFLPQHMSSVGTRFTGPVTGVTFTPGTPQSGTSSTYTTNVVYGTLWCTGTRSISFPTAFPAAPTLNAIMVNSAGGAISIQIDSVTSTGFTFNCIGLYNTSTAQFQWSAYVNGQ